MSSFRLTVHIRQHLPGPDQGASEVGFVAADEAAARLWSEAYVSDLIEDDDECGLDRAELSAPDGVIFWEWRNPHA